MSGVARLEAAFPAPGGLGLMAHAVCGYPDMETSLSVMAAMAASGASIIEAQIPFSEPSADGPLLIEANHAALRGGATTRSSLAMLAELRKEVEVPILAMSYLNPIFAYGPAAFAAALAAAGIDGAIIPDYPDDEPDPPLQRLFAEAGLALVPLVAPSTGLGRAASLAAASLSPLVYVVLRLGVTGRRTEIDEAAKERLSGLREATGRKIAAGFGIREAAQVAALRGYADCAIVGSALVAETKRARGAREDPVAAVAALVRRLLGG